MRYSILLLIFALLMVAGCSVIEPIDTNLPNPITFTVTDRPDSDLIYRELSYPGAFPYGMAYDGTNLWVVDYTDEDYYKINLKTATITKVTNLAFSGAPSGMCYGDGALYVMSGAVIYRVSLSDFSSTLWANVTNTNSNGPTGLAYNAPYIYALDRYEQKIHTFSNSVLLKTVERVEKMISPRDMVYYDGLVWIVDSSGKICYGVNPDTGLAEKSFFTPQELVSTRGVERIGNEWWFSDMNRDILAPTYVEVTPSGNALRSIPHRAMVSATYIFTNLYPLPLANVRVKFAMPESTPRQEIYSIQFKTFGMMEQEDAFGQKIAYFEIPNVEPNEVITVGYTADVRLWGIRYSIPANADLADIPSEILQTFTNDHSMLNYSNASLQSAALSIVDEKTNIASLALESRNAVLDQVDYIRDGIWDSADVVWNRGSGSCTEYSLTLSALLRANECPTRMVSSTIFSETSATPTTSGEQYYLDDVRHRWIEVYFPLDGWLPIDANAEDSSTGVYLKRYFFGINYGRFEISHTFIDDDYLKLNTVCRTWYSLGENVYDSSKTSSRTMTEWIMKSEYDRP